MALLEEINRLFSLIMDTVYDLNDQSSIGIGFKTWVTGKNGPNFEKPDPAKGSGSEIEILNKSNMMKWLRYLSEPFHFFKNNF